MAVLDEVDMTSSRSPLTCPTSTGDHHFSPGSQESSYLGVGGGGGVRACVCVGGGSIISRSKVHIDFYYLDLCPRDFCCRWRPLVHQESLTFFSDRNWCGKTPV